METNLGQRETVFNLPGMLEKLGLERVVTWPVDRAVDILGKALQILDERFFRGRLVISAQRGPSKRSVEPTLKLHSK